MAKKRRRKPPGPAREACPQCGFSYAFDGKTCGHCRWGTGHVPPPPTPAESTDNLYLACRVNKTEDAREAVEAGADVHGGKRPGEKPLLVATWKSGPEIINLLLDRGARRVEYPDWPYPTDEAAAERVRGDWELARAFERMGYAIDPSWVQASIFDSVGAGDTQRVRRWLKENSNLVHATENGTSPLHLAVSCRQSGVAEILLKEGADVNAPSALGTTPLLEACGEGDIKAASLLLRHGADPNRPRDSKDCATPLHSAVHVHSERLVDLLLRSGADPNATSRWRKPPLYYALEFEEDLAIARRIVRSGARLNPRGASATPPLVHAATCGRLKAVKMVLAAGARLDARGPTGETAAESARACGHHRVASFLESA